MHLLILILGLHLLHMEVPGLGVRLDCTRATAMQDLGRVFDLHHSSQQHQILNPLIEARDRTCVLMDASQIRFH